MSITRRDFLNGVAITIAAGMTPLELLAAAPNSELARKTLENYYPPGLTGLRGSHEGSYENAHYISRDGKRFDFSAVPAAKEEYDLVVVGAGISGLAAAVFYQQKMGKDKKILLIDNHDDFGGHAKRNEFQTSEGLIIGYGGSESFQSPRSLFSDEMMGLLKTLKVDLDELESCFNVNFYPNMGLSRGTYFDAKNFGVNKVVAGDPGANVADEIPKDKINGRSLEEFVADFPFNDQDKADLLALMRDDIDYFPGMSKDEKAEWMASNSYATFLRERVKLSKRAALYFQRSTDDFMAVGIDSTSCEDAWMCALPGFGGTELHPMDEEVLAELEDPYTFHFPGGNAGLARLMVRYLIPSVATGSTMQDIALDKFDYSQLDLPENNVRLRLNSTGVFAQNIEKDGQKGVEVVYVQDGKLTRVKAKQSVMACYNMMIPYLMPELSKEQKQALSQNVKAPLVYTNVVIRNWQSFVKLGVHNIYSPAAPYCMVKLDYPVDMGGYKHPRDPNKPICLHMVYVPNFPGSALPAREQSRKGRALLLGMSFEQHEAMIREQLQGMLGSAGFNHEKDILGITVNRWSHGYSYAVNTLFDDEDECEKIIETARQPVGNITIANSDSDWSPYAHAAVDQAWRAVNELVGGAQ